MRSTTFVRALFYSSATLFCVMFAVNLISLTGFDLTTLLAYPVEHWETITPEGLLLLPTMGVVLLLLVPLIAGGRLHLIVPQYGRWPTGINGVVGVVLVYAAAMLVYIAIRLPGGAPDVDHGQLTINTRGVMRIISPQEYRRDVAIALAYVSSWLMIPLSFLGVSYRDWLQELNERQSRTRL